MQDLPQTPVVVLVATDLAKRNTRRVQGFAHPHGFAVRPYITSNGRIAAGGWRGRHHSPERHPGAGYGRGRRTYRPVADHLPCPSNKAWIAGGTRPQGTAVGGSRECRGCWERHRHVELPTVNIFLPNTTYFDALDAARDASIDPENSPASARAEAGLQVRVCA